MPSESGPDSITAGAMRGDREALHALWREHRRWIAAVLLIHKPRQEDLDDLLQEVALMVVAKIHTLRDELNVRSWLRTVAVNVARAAARSGRSRHQPRLAGEDVLIDAAEEAGNGMDEHARHVMRLALELPEAYREPLILKAVHGLRSRQIAEALQIAEATVDTRVSRARRMLRELARTPRRPHESHNDESRNVESRNGESPNGVSNSLRSSTHTRAPLQLAEVSHDTN